MARVALVSQIVNSLWPVHCPLLCYNVGGNRCVLLMVGDMLRNLKDSIVDYDLNLLRAIARMRGFELRATRQAPAVEELAGYLVDQAATDWIWSRLSDEAREAVETILRAGGQMKAHIFGDRFGTPRSFGPGRLDREKPWLDPQSPAELLWFMGLIFSTFAPAGGDHRAEFVYIPSDVIPLLPPVEIVLPRFEIQPVEEPSLTYAQGTHIVDATFDLLCQLQTNPLPTDTDRRLTHAAKQYLEANDPFTAAMLAGPGGAEKSERLDFGLHLALSAGLLHVSGQRLRPQPAPARKWLKWTREQQVFHLQQTWRNDPGWNELWHIPELLIEETGWTNDAVLAREAILRHLGDCATDACPLGAWLSVEGLSAAVKAVDPDFARPDGDYRSWYIRDRDGGEYLMDYGHWDQVEGRLVKALLAGPLYWLGAVELGCDLAGWTAFRISPSGEALLGKSRPPNASEAPAATLEVRPDFTVHFAHDARLYERFQTQRFARLVPDSGTDLVYQISRGSLATAHAQGISTQMILLFLQQHSASPLPTSVVRALHNWQAE